MPARTNSFQAVIYLIKAHLSEGATVTESKMLVDRLTGGEREVDVCVESKIAGHAVTVCVECRDWARPQDVTWVEQMHSKHDRLPTNVLVLASSSGFTERAQQLADTYGIETVTPGVVADDQTAQAVTKRLGQMTVKKLEIAAKYTRFWVERVGAVPVHIFDASPDHAIYFRDGTEAGSAVEMTRHLLRLASSAEVLRDATSEDKSFVVAIDPPAEVSGALPEAQPLYLRSIDDAEPGLRKIIKIEVGGPAIVGSVPIPLSYHEVQGAVYASGESELQGHDVLVVITEPEREQRKLSIRFTPTKKRGGRSAANAATKKRKPRPRRRSG